MGCRCKVCKEPISKIKYNLEDYVYRKGDNFFCSYKCMLKYERIKNIPSIHMKWIKETEHSIIAGGNEGMFRIEFDGLWWKPVYLGYDGLREQFKKFKQKKYAKACCENSEYWEEWENEYETNI